jgi:hypothetical protein
MIAWDREVAVEPNIFDRPLRGGRVCYPFPGIRQPPMRINLRGRDRNRAGSFGG